MKQYRARKNDIYLMGWGKGTNHLSNELEASRKLHPKHIKLLLIDEPLLKRKSHELVITLFIHEYGWVNLRNKAMLV